MKYFTFMVLPLLFFCIGMIEQQPPSALTGGQARQNSGNVYLVCWTGTLNNKTPIIITYQVNDSIVTGHIVYQNTKDKKPITLIGTVESDQSLRLLEFEANGNITGIITGTPAEKVFNGTWFSPKSRKELTLKAVKKDTVLPVKDIETTLPQVFGQYHYQYSEAGYQGDFDIKKLPGAKAAFGISSVTGAPARNIAQVDDDTITLNKTQFSYKLADTEDCGFIVKFYKGFAYVKYTKEFCDGQFGHNATIEGIFLKLR